MMRTRRFIPSFCWLLIVCIFVVSGDGQPIEADSSGSQRLKVLTLNVWSGLNYQGTWKMGEYETDKHRRKRYKLLVRRLEDVAPDMVLLQEVNPAPTYASRLAEELGYQVVYQVSKGGIRIGPVGLPTNLREGNAILVSRKFSMRDLGGRKISGTGMANNYFTFHLSEMNHIMGVEVRVSNYTLYLFNTHLHSGPGIRGRTRKRLETLRKNGEVTSRKYQQIIDRFRAHKKRRESELEKALQFVEAHQSKGGLTLFAGDLNLVPEERAYRTIRKNGFRDTYRLNGDHRPYTWDPGQNRNFQQYFSQPEEPDKMISQALWSIYQIPKRIDYLWIRGPESSYTVIRTERFGTEAEQGIHLSDHFGHLVVLELFEQ